MRLYRNIAEFCRFYILQQLKGGTSAQTRIITKKKKLQTIKLTNNSNNNRRTNTTFWKWKSLCHFDYKVGCAASVLFFACTVREQWVCVFYPTNSVWLHPPTTVSLQTHLWRCSATMQRPKWPPTDQLGNSHSNAQRRTYACALKCECKHVCLYVCVRVWLNVHVTMAVVWQCDCVYFSVWMRLIVTAGHARTRRGRHKWQKCAHTHIYKYIHAQW